MKNIDGKYRVLGELGEGFGGEVYLVESESTRMALKKLRIQAGGSPLSPLELLDNFKQEFTTLKKLNHPNILRILDFGYDSKRRFHYFTTEYIEGQNIFEATRGLEPDTIEDIFVQTLRALSYLHSQRVYHFDIKPSNILITTGPGGAPVAKIIDFGLTAFQKKGLFAGSPSYSPPEAMFDQPRDGRSDLYSLGVTWYECLTGTNPFFSPDVRKMLDMHRVWTPPSISSQGTAVPKYLDPILEKLLRKNPAHRYHRADQVIRDLNWSAKKKYPLETEATALSYIPGMGQLIGREKEWNQLLDVFNRIFVTASAPKTLLTMSGDAGTGKSRLLAEMKYHAQLHTVEVHDINSIAPGQLKSDALLLADNADEGTLATARLWMQQFSTYAFLIVLAGKKLRSISDPGLHIHLENLKQAEVGLFIASVLGVEEPPAFLVEEIHSRSEGNPFFLTEVLSALIRDHQVFDSQGRWSPTLLQQVGINFEKLAVSPSLQDYCRLKFENLPENARHYFSLIALSRVPLTRHDLTQIGLGWDSSDWKKLEEEKMISMDPLSGQFRLLNPNFTEWIGRNLDKQQQAEIHQELGKILAVDPERTMAGRYHLGFGQGEATERLGHLLRYCDSLSEQYLWLEAASLLERAEGIAPTVQDAVEVNLRRARFLIRANRRNEANGLLERTQEILKEVKDNPGHWRWVQRIYCELGSLYLKDRRLDLSREAFQSSRVLLEEHEDNPTEKMILENFRASILMREGRLLEAMEVCQNTLDRWQNLSWGDKQKVLNNELGNIYLAQANYSAAATFYQNQAAFLQEVGNLSKRASALYGWAESCYFLGRFDEAKALYHSCADLSRQLKIEEMLFHAYNGLGNLSFTQQAWSEAAEFYEKALELSQHHADVDSTVGIAINLALVFRLHGDFSSSLVYLNHVIETLELQVPPSLHQVGFLLQAYLELGSLRLEKLEALEARDAFRDAVRLIKIYPSLERFRFAASVGLAQSHIDLDRLPEAENLLQSLGKVGLNEEERQELESLRAEIKRAFPARSGIVLKR